VVPHTACARRAVEALPQEPACRAGTASAAAAGRHPPFLNLTTENRMRIGIGLGTLLLIIILIVLLT